MAPSFRLLAGGRPAAVRRRSLPAVSVERENTLFVESALVALVAAVRASRVQILRDLADLEDRAASALEVAVRVREAVEAGALASDASRASAERDLADIGRLLRSRAAGAHRSIVSSSADTVEAAFEVASFAAARHLSADLRPRSPVPGPRGRGPGSGCSPLARRGGTASVRSTVRTES